MRGRALALSARGYSVLPSLAVKREQAGTALVST
jgi:hypothetical protein